MYFFLICKMYDIYTNIDIDTNICWMKLKSFQIFNYTNLFIIFLVIIANINYQDTNSSYTNLKVLKLNKLYQLEVGKIMYNLYHEQRLHP